MQGIFFDINLAGQRLRIRAGNAHPEHRYIWRAERHCHGEYELHIILSGHARVEIGTKVQNLHPGQALIIAPGKYHMVASNDGELERFSLLITVPKGELAENLAAAVEQFRVFDVPGKLQKQCEEYYYETEAVNIYRRELQHALLNQILIGLLRQIGIQQEQVKSGVVANDLERRSIIDDFFGDSLRKGAGQEELAARLHLSTRQLARVLQKDYGMSYREMLARSCMDRAAWLLRTTELPIPRVAEQVGYRSESAFYKVFFKEFGMTPLHYRRQNHE